MGAFDKLSESIKKAEKSTAEETDERVLDRFEMKDLRITCRVYGIREPAQHQIDILTDEKGELLRKKIALKVVR